MAALDSADPFLTAARVVVIDACSALDVVRIPVRPEWSADAKSVEGVLDIANDPAILMLVMTSAIEVEFTAHRDSEAATVRHELRRRQENLDDDSQFMADMVMRCGLASGPPAKSSLDWFESIGDRFEALSDTVQAALTVGYDDDVDVMLAWSRVAVRRAPANRGTKSMADCVLCEAALRIARQRPPSTTGLLTSNKKDFRQAGSLHSDLDATYGDAGLVDLSTWRDVLMFARAGKGT